jgi:hypothetical protein
VQFFEFLKNNLFQFFEIFQNQRTISFGFFFLNEYQRTTSFNYFKNLYEFTIFIKELAKNQLFFGWFFDFSYVLRTTIMIL